MRTSTAFNRLYIQARRIQRERLKHEEQRYVAASGRPAFDPEQPIPREDLPLLYRLAQICARRMAQITDARQAGEISLIVSLELSEPIEIVTDYITERLARCTVAQWPGPGERFDRLEVIGTATDSKGKPKQSGHSRVMRCRCDCGKIVDVALSNLARGNTTSCGCRAREVSAERATIHGDAGSRLYWIWHNMVERTTNPTAGRYQDYGGRGITICQEWRSSYADFMAWAMANGYQPGLQVDRVDNDGPYSPDNCRWATRKQQCRNTRRNTVVTYNGRPMALIEASELSGIPYGTLIKRRLNGWPEAKLFAPVRSGRR